MTDDLRVRLYHFSLSIQKNFVFNFFQHFSHSMHLWDVMKLNG